MPYGVILSISGNQVRFDDQAGNPQTMNLALDGDSTTANVNVGDFVELTVRRSLKNG